MPSKKVNKFFDLGDEVYNAIEVKPLKQEAEEKGIIEGQIKEVPNVVQEQKVESKPLPSPSKPKVTGNRTIIYKVRKGDAMSIIADYYDCYVSDIKRWNGLRSTRINYGQRLKIVIPASNYDYYIRINKMSAAELNRIRNKD